MDNSVYQGTSLWLWVVQGIIWCMVVAFVIAIGYVLLLIAAFLIIVAIVAFLLWWAYLEIRDRLDPPVAGMSEYQVRRALYGWPVRHRLPR